MAGKRDRTALNRMLVKIQGEATRMFEAAEHDRMTLTWDTVNWTIDQIIYSQLRILRGRSRNQTYNNGYMSRFVTVLQNNVPGANGVQFRSKIVDQQGKADYSARKAIGDAWQDFTEFVDLINMQHVIFNSMVSDGEAFVRLDRDKGHLYPVMIDPNLVDINFNQN